MAEAQQTSHGSGDRRGEHELAPWCRRAAAGLIDLTLLMGALVVFTAAVEWLWWAGLSIPFELLVLAVVARLGLCVLYWPLFEASKWQATPGKMLLRIRVVTVTGERVALVRGLWRHLLRAVSVGTVVGLLPILWGRPALHDALSGSRVIL